MTRSFPPLAWRSLCSALVASLVATSAFAAAPLGYVSSVQIGPQDPSGILPTFNQVPGTSTANLDVALPQSILTRGQGYAVMIMSQVGPYTGTCETTYSLTQTIGGVKTTLSSGKIKPYSCATGDIFGWVLNTKRIGGSAGAAVLTGETTFGTEQVRLNVPLLLQ